MEIASHKNWATTGANADFRQEVDGAPGGREPSSAVWLKPPTENPGDEPRANVCCLVSVCLVCPLFHKDSVYFCPSG